MNRAERRKLMRKIPAYRKTIKTASKNAVDDLEKAFEKIWKEKDEKERKD